MSLELTIARNNELLEQLINAINAKGFIAASQEIANDAPVVTKAKTEKTKPAVTEAKPTVTKAAEKVTETAESSTLTYQETAKWVIRVSNEVSRDRTVSILIGFGLKTLKDAKPEQWAGIVEECQAALKEAA